LIGENFNPLIKITVNPFRKNFIVIQNTQLQRKKFHVDLRLIAGSLLLIANLVFAGFILYSLAGDVSLWVFGKHTLGKVEDLYVERIDDGSASEMQFEYYVRYSFSTPNGKIYTRKGSLSAQEWSSLSIARPDSPDFDQLQAIPPHTTYSMLAKGLVEVVYFPLYPQHSRLAEGRYVLFLGCLYVPFLALIWVGYKFSRYLLEPLAKH
jgi:hypothetical protein